MDKANGLLLCILIVFIDILAGIVGLGAYNIQDKNCEPSHLAFALGLIAALMLGLAHALANWMGGCARNCFKNGKFSGTCFVLSCIAFVIGFIMLVVGTASNLKSRASCGFSQRLPLSSGGIFCFLHGVFSVSYYVSVVEP